jgi:hypothetical protein
MTYKLHVQAFYVRTNKLLKMNTFFKTIVLLYIIKNFKKTLNVYL